jgi:hypothetical protein
LRDHSPENKESEPRFDSFQHFVFETVLRLFAPRLSDGRVKREGLRIPIREFDYRVTRWTTVCTALFVPFTALCATFLAVIAVLFATFFAVRAGPASTLGMLPTQRPNARNIENNIFMVPKVS